VKQSFRDRTSFLPPNHYCWSTKGNKPVARPYPLSITGLIGTTTPCDTSLQLWRTWGPLQLLRLPLYLWAWPFSFLLAAWAHLGEACGFKGQRNGCRKSGCNSGEANITGDREEREKEMEGSARRDLHPTSGPYYPPTCQLWLRL